MWYSGIYHVYNNILTLIPLALLALSCHSGNFCLLFGLIWMVKTIKYTAKLSSYSIDWSINTDFEQIFWFWPLRGLQWCAEREVGQATGLSVLPRGQSWPLKTVCVCSSPPPGCCLPQHHSHTVPLPLFPSVSCFLILLWQTSPPLFWLRAAYNQHVPHVLDKSRGSFSAGAGWQHQPCNPSIHPPVCPPPPLCPRLPPTPHPLAFSILSCRGKRWPEESNNCDSGAFLALFLKLCRHTQGCLLALMKG